MLPGSLSERRNCPCDINHKNKRCDDWFRAETKPFRAAFSGRISSIPIKELLMQTEFARGQMITQQVRAWDVLDDRVLDAMRRTPREFFVPERFADLAFADAGIPLSRGQHMLPPKIVGRLLQALDARAGTRALVVGCGTGFVPACLSAMGASVRAIEIQPELAAAARANLKRAGFGQVEVVTGDTFNLDLGKDYAVIAVCGALPLYDDRFARALATGGRLFVVVGEREPQEALLVTRESDGSLVSTGLFETVVDPLENAPRPERFQF
jgi:protein-L-isoaspartate(D-aspartate) O-methyltransferase